MSDNTKKKKQFRLPHMYLVIAILMLFVSLLTYVVPAGSYTRGGNGAVDPDSFTYTDSSPVGILSFFTSIRFDALLPSARQVVQVSVNRQAH